MSPLPLIVALWLANKDNKPNLKVHVTIDVIIPEMIEHLWLLCVTVTHFRFIVKKDLLCQRHLNVQN